MKNTQSMKRTLGLAAAGLLILIMFFLPTPEGLTGEGKMSLVIMVAGIIVWITEALPQCISAMFLMMLLPYFGLLSFNETCQNFMSGTFFFLMASFTFTMALKKTTVPIRVTSFLLKWSKGSPRKVVFSFLLASWLLSLVVSNIAATAMFVPLAVGLLEANGDRPLESGMGRALMMAVPYGAFIGGCTLLCGSSANVTVLGLTEKFFGFTVDFMTWAIIGIPFAIIMIPVTWFALCMIYKPEPVKKDVIDDTVARADALGALSAFDLKVLMVIGLCLILWILSTWFPIFKTWTVGILGIFLMFLPGIEVMDFKEWSSNMSWNALLLLGCVMSLASAISATGASTWLASLVIPLVDNAGAGTLLGISGASSILIRLILPAASAMAGVTVEPFCQIAISAGCSMTAMVMLMAWVSGTTYMLPVDSLMMIPYSSGYSSMSDPVKAGIVPSVTSVLIACTILPLICTFLGV